MYFRRLTFLTGLDTSFQAETPPPGAKFKLSENRVISTTRSTPRVPINNRRIERSLSVAKLLQ